MNYAIFLTALIAGAGIVYDAVEFYQARAEVLQKFYNWQVVRSRYYILINRPVLTLFFDAVFAPKTFIAFVVAHGFAALLFPIVFYYSTGAAAVLAFLVLSVHCLINIRLLVGRDGADQMQNIVWAGIFAYCLPLNENVKLVAAGFIAAQLILSYFTSGIAKLVSPVWRAGSGMQLITRMASYCPPNIAVFFVNKKIAFVACWAVILFEILGPFLLLFGQTGAIIFIAMGTLFHVGIAISMGLTTFVFSFIATYPIIYELALKFRFF